MRKASHFIAAMFLPQCKTGICTKIPAGSYIKICTDIRESTESIPYVLEADFQGRHESKGSVLDFFDNCYNDIENYNGWLTCNYKAKCNNFYTSYKKVTFNKRKINAKMNAVTKSKLALKIFSLVQGKFTMLMVN